VWHREAKALHLRLIGVAFDAETVHEDDRELSGDQEWSGARTVRLFFAFSALFLLGYLYLYLLHVR
jgi:hypothetical protein